VGPRNNNLCHVIGRLPFYDTHEYRLDEKIKKYEVTYP
jgi:hypothetical protein